MFRFALLAMALLFAGAVPSSAEQNFQFGGLSLRTTVQDAVKRYPRSEVLGQHIYVADSESHDDIHAISLPATTLNRRLVVFFERAAAGGNSYPSCDKVLRALRAYGTPATVQEFDEERSRNRRFTWRQETEEMSLLCFRRPTSPTFLAAELTITGRTQ
jgi:hypothetical protein